MKYSVLISILLFTIGAIILSYSHSSKLGFTICIIGVFTTIIANIISYLWKRAE